ncbi:hypothetical protein Tco_1398356, partial [Tanacetum coccineum]
MGKLAFCDYHNMVANLEKTEHNQDFYQIVDFLRASHIRQRTITEASIRRFIQLNDARGMSTLLDTELFANLSLIGYNISENQKFSFQKGQFSHQWKFLIHTIMQCISPKSTGFNEFSSNIATAIVCFATNRTYNFSKMILDGMTSNIKRKSGWKGKDFRGMTFEQIEAEFTLVWETGTKEDLFSGADETASLTSDDRHREAFPTVSSLDAGQDRGNIAKTSAMPYDSPPRVTSLGGDEGTKIQDQALEITQLKARVKVLEDNDRRRHGISQEDASNRGGEAIRVSGEELAEKETSRSADKGSESTDEMANILLPLLSAVATTSATISLAVATATTTIPTTVTPHSRRTRASKEIELESSQPSFYTSVKTLSSKGKEKVTEPESVQNFKPMGSEEESKRFKRPRIQLEQMSSKRIKSAANFHIGQMRIIPSEWLGHLLDEDYKGMMELVPIEEVYIEALQVKRPIIGWYVYDDGNLKSWKIVRVGEHMELYQTFEDMVKRIDREDLDKLWSLAQEVYEKGQLLDDKEKQLWVELKRLYEPDPIDQLWKIQRYMYDPLEWRLYDSCVVHHVATSRGHEIFMLVEKDYPLTKGLTT